MSSAKPSFVLGIFALLAGCGTLNNGPAATANSQSPDVPTPTAPFTPPGNPTSSPLPTPDPNSPTSPTPPDNLINPYTLIGRFDMTDPNAPRFSLENTRIGATFTGTSLAVKLTDTGTDLFNVVIDNTPPIVITAHPSPTVTVYPIVEGLAAGQHTVWMSKRTEFLQNGGNESVGATQFFGFVVDPNASLLTPPPARTRHVEFIGDSGYSGYGAGQIMTGGSDGCSYTPENEDAESSVPRYTGDFLNAEIINMSSSGEGVYQSVYDSNPNHLLPVLYNQTVPPGSILPWDFSRWNADVVVISAGGDDLAGASANGYFPNPGAFVDAYATWLAQIRQHYPRALIVSVLSQSASGNDIVTLGGALQQAVAVRTAAGDPNVVYYDYFQGDSTYQTYDDVASALHLYWGCSYHPSPQGASWLATRLAAFIKTRMGW